MGEATRTRYFELVGGKHMKFWQITYPLNSEGGVTVTTLYGRIGTTGSTWTGDSHSWREAYDKARHLIRLKGYKGYVELDLDDAIIGDIDAWSQARQAKKSAKEPLDEEKRELVRSLLAAGWDSAKIAKTVHLTVQQVAAVKAHEEMGSYSEKPKPIVKTKSVVKVVKKFQRSIELED